GFARGAPTAIGNRRPSEIHNGVRTDRRAAKFSRRWVPRHLKPVIHFIFNNCSWPHEPADRVPILYQCAYQRGPHQAARSAHENFHGDFARPLWTTAEIRSIKTLRNARSSVKQ